MSEHKSLTSKEFAIILGNHCYTGTFVHDLSISIPKIEDNYNQKQKFGIIKIRYLKTLGMCNIVMKLETSSFIFAEELADSIQEVLPTHGIAVAPWSIYTV